ncbi:MAG: molybdopterin-guanine dinucleotide biosynthesis protein MobB [Thermoplasmataceae archaeon]
MKLFRILIAGPSGAGKTTISEQIIGTLSREGIRVSFIKDIPHDDADFDKKGKDTYRAISRGAVMSIGRSPSGSFINIRGNMDLDKLLQIAENSSSVCIVEGFASEASSLHFDASIYLKVDQSEVKSSGAHAQVRSDKGRRDFDLEHGSLELVDFIASLVHGNEEHERNSE